MTRLRALAAAAWALLLPAVAATGTGLSHPLNCNLYPHARGIFAEILVPSAGLDASCARSFKRPPFPTALPYFLR